MSSRVLKKLQGGTDVALGLPANDNDDQLSDEEDEQDASDKGNHLNPFDLLNQQSFSESEVKEDDNETEHTSTAINVPAGSAAAKKRKKKRKKKTKYTKNPISSEDNEMTDKYLSDIDPLIGKVCDAANQSAKLAKPRIKTYNNLLSVELRNLNPQNELRRTFGKRVVKIENKRGRQKLTLKSTYMVTAKEAWPPVTKNIITMKTIPPPDMGTSSCLAKSSNGIQWFAFEHSQYYQRIQNMFLPAVERTDSDYLINLIRRCPYHVDSLIQLSELCKMTEDYALGGELIERALLVLESSLHPSFSLTSGLCRLDYRRQENRSFFIVLFKQAQYLEARACCRTAFELSKLILSLNPETDPLAMVLILDYYALRSKQFAWMIKFYEEYDATRNLSQLPNMAYSYALALFCVNGECEKADKALQYAMLMFPGAVRRLLEELSSQKDKPNALVSSSYFNNEVSSNQSPALHQLICLYHCRARVIWRQSNIMPWLERNINAILKRIDDSKDDVIKDYCQKRATRYTTPPRPILRHVFLSDYKEEVPLGIFTMHEKGSIVAYDPLPPQNSVNCYERKSSSSSPSTSRNRPVTSFFQSFLPQFDARADAENVDAGAGGANANAAGNERRARDAMEADIDRRLQNLENAVGEGVQVDSEAATSYRELTQSLTNIVDAMRDFLHNFHISETLQPVDAEENGSSEEDTTDFFD